MSNDDSNNVDRNTEAYKELRKLILFRRLPPGTPIIQAHMADRLGHSRGTIRVALQRLTQEGYVIEKDLGTYSRFVVAYLTADDMRDLFAIVGALEGVAARKCADLPRDTRRELAARLAVLNERGVAAAREPRVDPEDANTIDTEFHQAFVEAAMAPRLVSQLDSIRPQVERYRDIYTAHVVAEVRTEVAPEHREILDAIEQGEPDRAQRAVETHWRNGARRVSQLIEDIGEHRGYSHA